MSVDSALTNVVYTVKAAIYDHLLVQQKKKKYGWKDQVVFQHRVTLVKSCTCPRKFRYSIETFLQKNEAGVALERNFEELIGLCILIPEIESESMLYPSSKKQKSQKGCKMQVDEPARAKFPGHRSHLPGGCSTQAKCLYKMSVHEIPVVGARWSLNVGPVYCNPLLFLLEVTCALAPGPWRSTRL